MNRRHRLMKRSALAVGMMTTRLLPAEQRARYEEEFRAEFCDLQSGASVLHAAGLVWAVWSLRAELCRRPRLARPRFLVPLASAAAVLTISLTGLSLLARSAQPGDTLWGLSRVLYPEHALSIESAAFIRTDLDTARLALREGMLSEAWGRLQRVAAVLPAVQPDDGLAQLSTKHQELSQELSGGR